MAWHEILQIAKYIEYLIKIEVGRKIICQQLNESFLCLFAFQRSETKGKNCNLNCLVQI